MVRLVRAFLVHVDVAGLGIAQLGKLRFELGKLQSRYLLVQMLRKNMNPDRLLVRIIE